MKTLNELWESLKSLADEITFKQMELSNLVSKHDVVLRMIFDKQEEQRRNSE